MENRTNILRSSANNGFIPMILWRVEELHTGEAREESLEQTAHPKAPNLSSLATSKPYVCTRSVC